MTLNIERNQRLITSNKSKKFHKIISSRFKVLMDKESMLSLYLFLTLTSVTFKSRSNKKPGLYIMYPHQIYLQQKFGDDQLNRLGDMALFMFSHFATYWPNCKSDDAEYRKEPTSNYKEHVQKISQQYLKPFQNSRGDKGKRPPATFGNLITIFSFKNLVKNAAFFCRSLTLFRFITDEAEDSGSILSKFRQENCTCPQGNFYSPQNVNSTEKSSSLTESFSA